MMGDFMRHKVFTYFLGLLFIVGTITGPIALYVANKAANDSQTAPTAAVNRRAADAGEFAALFISTWLQGDAETLALFSTTVKPAATNLAVGKVSAIQSTEDPTSIDLFDVIVAAELYNNGAFETIGFYAVGVAAFQDTTGLTPPSGLRIVGPPSRVSAPKIYGNNISRVGFGGQPDQVPELKEPLEEFFNGYLTSTNNQTDEQRLEAMKRVTRPEIEITPIRPAPYNEANLIGINFIDDENADDVRVVNAQVLAVDANGSQELNYSIVMQKRDDRWEVQRLLGSPPIKWEG